MSSFWVLGDWQQTDEKRSAKEGRGPDCLFTWPNETTDACRIFNQTSIHQQIENT
jgi:hypothetical protein